MADNVRFTPVMGPDEKIQLLPRTEGRVYFATDTRKIYLDTDKDDKLAVGGAGNSGIYYGKKELTDEEKELEEIQFTLLNDIEGDELPNLNDLILNADGCFYKVISVSVKNKIVTGFRLTVAGSGGGGTSSIIRPSLTLHDIETPIIVNGQSFEIYFTAKSALDENNIPFNQNLTINWTLIDADTKQIYYTGIPKTAVHDEITSLNVGEYLKPSASTIIQLQASGNNHDQASVFRQVEITSVEMYLKQISSYNPAIIYNSENVVLNCNAIGRLSKILEWSVDGQVLHSEVLPLNSTNQQSFIIPKEFAGHGYHVIEVNLYQNLGSAENPVKGLSATSLKYEIAVKEENNKKPIIWLGEYKDNYYNYEVIQIPFLVYDPTNLSEVKVRLYKNDIEIDGSPRTIKDFSTFNYWQIADAVENNVNYYSIACGSTTEMTVKREIEFTISESSMKIKSENLKLNFDPAGRSNSEPEAKRKSWTYEKNGEKISAIFKKFNWNNNGWLTDKDTKNTFLRISNGAKITIPFNELEFEGSTDETDMHSLELVFKIRNIQDYSNLITNITRYNDDEEYYKEFKEQNIYNNYDAFLQNKLLDKYDELKFNFVEKVINLNNIVCGFYNTSGENSVTGFCVGTRDAFFSNGTNTVSVNFVENEMIHLSFVYNSTSDLLCIYVNGVITGVIKNSIGSFKIESNEIILNSEKCDIDLYKIRIYNTALNVSEIVSNYAVDEKDVDTFEQSVLAKDNEALKEYQLDFSSVIQYNKEHPTEPLMPYIIFDTTGTTDQRLPYAKSKGTKNIKVEFINAPLDSAYARGELVKKCVNDGLLKATESDQEKINNAVKTYYKHNCPSWTSTLNSDDIVTIEVQGTSSEFYPRRNFKIKTKNKTPNTWGDLKDEEGNVTGQGWTKEDCLNIFMHKGPFEDVYTEDLKKADEDEHYYGSEKSRLKDGWYMNNYTNPTDRWTMKVDYMESSGSYNAGFANLVANAYTKHPLQDYLGVITNEDDLKSSISEFSRSIRWDDYRTSLLGFPVMAFQKRRVEGSEEEEEYLFIGYYRMLLDKGSDQVLGFKPSKNIKHTLLNEKLRDVAECWEFSTNARTFCSYKDPWNRVELSFKAPRSKGLDGFIKISDKIIGGPVVLNHFEPRYFKFKDYLANDENGFYNFGSLTQDIVNDMCDDIGINRININNAEAPYLAQDEAVKLMGNWEKVCKWIYSTNLDNVASQGSYKKIPVGLVTYVPDGRFYILQGSDYVPATEDFNEETIYFKIESVTEKDPVTGEDIVRDNYVNAYATEEDKIYEPNKFYILTSGVYSLCQDTVFDSSKTYYKFESLDEEDIAKIADLLITPAETYNPDTIYYTYNSDAEVNPGKPTGAVIEKGKISEEEFLKGKYYVPTSKRFGDEESIEYHYDTKEYRTEKFMNELTKHFDPEYLATYFIMTEIFECYDSRGKNCMMASWGPQKEGGEYIWYPIFYDIDTQLGINNTGIPSFEFNVDATEAGNYSTSDSVLWNNFYKMFKGSYILEKYRHLRGSKSDLYGTMETPLVDANNLEKWYTFDPEITKNIANKGKRPLIATNLDLYWKYITITNPASLDQNVAYIPGVDGTYTYDKKGTYYYALQGDRSQSRRQFLTSRIEYLDSWLNQGNYSRGGNNRIRGRISANSISKDTTSDKWVERLPDAPYWKNNVEFGEKTHDFDGEYWATLKPIQSTYVTAADDSGTYPSQKYDGVNPVKFKLNDIETGIRQSEDYPEQLVYLYGMNQMSDFGDLNKLYWREFYMEGNADHLTRLQLGYDGYSKTDPDIQWFNKELNGITLTKMPLLKEANFSRIGLKNSTTLDLTDSEKLENFRAVGTSNLVGVEFANGVALNTVYLPQSVTSLKLVKANLLTNLIESSIAPTPINEEDGTVTPPTQGLFLEGFFGNSFGTSLRSIHFDGGSLGYGSYKILKRCLDIVKYNPAGSYKFKITMNDVNWSPYQKLTEGTVYNENETYYEDDKHYGFKVWQKNASTFENLVLNGKLYTLKEDVSNIIGNDFVTDIQNNLRNTSIFSDASSSAANPIISGIVYVNNDEKHAVEESDIRNKLQPLYPNLTFFFANVNKAYSAEFLYRDSETGIDKYVPFKNGSEEDSIQKISKEDFEKDRTIWFEDPFKKYKPEKTHYDFIGWSTNPDADPEKNMQDIITEGNWSGEIEEDKYDYIYYAIFKIHAYDVIFHDGDGSELITIKVDYGKTPQSPSIVPYKDDSNLDDEIAYKIIGYTDNPLNNKIINLDNVIIRNNTHYYPIFEEISVYDNFYYIDDSKKEKEDRIYFDFEEYLYNESGSYTDAPEWANKKGYLIKLKEGVILRGKITLPVFYNNMPIVGIAERAFEQQSGITHIYFQNKLNLKDENNTCSNELRTILSNAFNQCSNLKIFDWPSKLRSLQKNAFYGCYNLESTEITSPLVYIGEQAFKYAFKPQNNNLLTLYIPKTIRNLGTQSFSGYKNCNYNNYGIDKIIDKIYFGSDELNTLDYIIVFASNKVFEATNVNQAIIYCSTEHYEIWNTPSMKNNFPIDTKFVFPLEEE